jgi:hypothetical protein
LLAEASKVLKTGGRIGIVEWGALDIGRGPALSERISPEGTLVYLAKAGFTETSARDIDERFHIGNLY